MNKEILKAFEFAAKYHKDQMYGEYGYLYHCSQVAQNVLDLIPTIKGFIINGFDKQNMVIAAILHDVCEDTNCSLQDVGEIFGFSVCWLVYSLTRVEEMSDFDYYDCMNKEAMIIKVADRLANLDNIGCNSEKIDKRLFNKVLPKYEKELKYYKDFPIIKEAYIKARKREELWREL